MTRKDFLKSCGSSCLAYLAVPLLLQNCGGGMKYVSGMIVGNQLRVFVSDFTAGGTELESIIVRYESSGFPIALFRHSENEYSALLLQCSHQGTELNVNGALLTCSAHGSEFSNTGAVLNGPASLPLISFPVTREQDLIFIHLD